MRCLRIPCCVLVASLIVLIQGGVIRADAETIWLLRDGTTRRSSTLRVCSTKKIITCSSLADQNTVLVAGLILQSAHGVGRGAVGEIGRAGQEIRALARANAAWDSLDAEGFFVVFTAARGRSVVLQKRRKRQVLLGSSSSAVGRRHRVDRDGSMILAVKEGIEEQLLVLLLSISGGQSNREQVIGGQEEERRTHGWIYILVVGE